MTTIKEIKEKAKQAGFWQPTDEFFKWYKENIEDYNKNTTEDISDIVAEQIFGKWRYWHTSNKYTYWKHLDGYYNCTPIGHEPPAKDEGGYWNLDTLRNLKGD